jgi:hypothetical protein
MPGDGAQHRDLHQPSRVVRVRGFPRCLGRARVTVRLHLRSEHFDRERGHEPVTRLNGFFGSTPRRRSRYGTPALAPRRGRGTC